ncbi:MAG: hypothetical protein AB7P17_00225 [Nitrospirales bacterium]|nr:hypothetical protein [Nitrospirales bacterium]
MKTLTTPSSELVYNSEDFKQFMPSNFSSMLERSSALIRRILQDMGQWADNTAHEKLLLRLSFDLLERFIQYCPSQLPGRPPLLLDGFISEYFGKPQEQEIGRSTASNPILHRFLDGLLKRAVLSRDALVCLFYHFYGMKPVEVGFLLGLEEGQTQRIYKNFARWRQAGWHQSTKEAGLTSEDLHALTDAHTSNPSRFHEEVGQQLDSLLSFYRKSDPPYYPCLSINKWQDMFSEGYGFDYRMWHLPLCLSCMRSVRDLGDSFLLNPQIQLNLQIFPHSLKDDESASPCTTIHDRRTERRRQASHTKVRLAHSSMAC